MIVINVEKFGDWDTLSTVVTMVSPAGMGKGTAKMIVKEAEELAKDTNDEESTIKYLKDHGFACTYAISCAVGKNL